MDGDEGQCVGACPGVRNDGEFRTPFGRAEGCTVDEWRLSSWRASETLAQEAEMTICGEPPNPETPVGRMPILEAAKLESLGKLIGPAKVDNLLGKFGAQLRGGLAKEQNGGEDMTALAREAHKLASSAGMLGFAELSRRCSQLQAALQDAGDFAPPLAEVRQACAEALAEISVRLGDGKPALKRA